MESLESCVGAVEAMAADAVDPAHHLELLAELERAHGSIDMHLGGAGDGPLELRGRAALVLLLARAAPSTAARRLRGADVVDLLGPRHAIDALVGAVVDGRRGDRAELRNLAAALGDCMLPTAYFRDDALDGPNEEAMAQLAKRFSGHVNHAARAILAQRALPLLLASGDDDVLAEALRIFADMMAFATEYTAKVRQHVAADCPFLVPDVLSILSRCLARLRAGADDGDDAAWDRAVLAARVLTVVTFKIKAARRSVCDANPTCAFLDAIEADQRREAPRLCGAGGAVALLVKLNVNIDGGFGPDWRAEAFSNAAAVGALVANLPRAARAQVSRHTALYDGTPVNRGSRAWPIFLSHVPLQNPTVQKSARAPVRAQRQTTLDGAPVRRRAEGKGDDDAPPAPSEAKHPTGAVEERGVSDSKAESKADSDADSKGEPSVDDAPTSPAAGDHSPPPSPPRGDGTSPRGDDASLRGDGDCKAEAYGASWVPHHLPPLRDSAAAAHGDGFTFGRLRSAAAPPPPAFLCALTGAVMDEPVAVAGGGGAVPSADGGRRWPVSGLPIADDDALTVDADLARRIQQYRFAQAFPL
ncbi:hypothetical protein M885DRAFT_622850 [Pelagophyceae sp. CCMP2097]|nr:hypothetical protein M885DRAFT_622850 [Pelagophyceae sp. CCMP2097]